MDKAANEPYTMALITYALQLAKSSKAESAWKMLKALKKSKDGVDYWTQGEEKKPRTTPFYYYDAQPPLDVEITAYALLTQVLRGELADGQF